jgi:hypothetical protein
MMNADLLADFGYGMTTSLLMLYRNVQNIEGRIQSGFLSQETVTSDKCFEQNEAVVSRVELPN